MARRHCQSRKLPPRSQPSPQRRPVTLSLQRQRRYSLWPRSQRHRSLPRRYLGLRHSLRSHLLRRQSSKRPSRSLHLQRSIQRLLRWPPLPLPQFLRPPPLLRHRRPRLLPHESPAAAHRARRRPVPICRRPVPICRQVGHLRQCQRPPRPSQPLRPLPVLRQRFLPSPLHRQPAQPPRPLDPLGHLQVGLRRPAVVKFRHHLEVVGRFHQAVSPFRRPPVVNDQHLHRVNVPVSHRVLAVPELGLLVRVGRALVDSLLGRAAASPPVPVAQVVLVPAALVAPVLAPAVPAQVAVPVVVVPVPTGSAVRRARRAVLVVVVTSTSCSPTTPPITRQLMPRCPRAPSSSSGVFRLKSSLQN